MKLQDLIDARQQYAEAVSDLEWAKAEAKNSLIQQGLNPDDYFMDPDYVRSLDYAMRLHHEVGRLSRMPLEA